jgi:hypothetical protein
MLLWLGRRRNQRKHHHRSESLSSAARGRVPLRRRSVQSALPADQSGRYRSLPAPGHARAVLLHRQPEPTLRLLLVLLIVDSMQMGNLSAAEERDRVGDERTSSADSPSRVFLTDPIKALTTTTRHDRTITKRKDGRTLRINSGQILTTSKFPTGGEQRLTA